MLFALGWLEKKFQPQSDDAWLLCPADHPTLDPAVVRQLLEARVEHPRASIFIPICDGRRGHPALIGWRHVGAMRALPEGVGFNVYLRQQAAANRHSFRSLATPFCAQSTGRSSAATVPPWTGFHAHPPSAASASWVLTVSRRTSSLVSSRPVWNWTPLRRVSLTCLASLLTSQLSASIGVGLGFGLSAMSKWSDAETKCPSKRCTNQGDTSLDDDAGAAADVSTVLVGVGAGAVLAGVILWLTAPKDHEHAVRVAFDRANRITDRLECT